MQLLDLLDRIDETAPRCCKTCRYMATHANCKGCLDATTPGVDANGVKQNFYQYTNWAPGNWLRDLHAAQLVGARRIVIGGQGEADFCATDDPRTVVAHLRYVAGECGYLVWDFNDGTDNQSVCISTHDGSYRLEWVGRELSRIVCLDRNGADVRSGWDANDPGASW